MSRYIDAGYGYKIEVIEQEGVATIYRVWDPAGNLIAKGLGTLKAAHEAVASDRERKPIPQPGF